MPLKKFLHLLNASSRENLQRGNGNRDSRKINSKYYLTLGKVRNTPCEEITFDRSKSTTTTRAWDHVTCRSPSGHKVGGITGRE